jgi:oligopeptide transport system substrate-binding protein
MWRKELGIDAQIRNEEWKVFLKNLADGNYQVGRLGWTADYPDPYTFLSVFLSTSGNNHSDWKDPAFDALTEEANLAATPEERLEKLAKAEEYLLDVMPAMPIYYYTRAYMVKPYVKGLHNNFQDRHPWKAIWLDPGALERREVENGDGGFVELP